MAIYGTLVALFGCVVGGSAMEGTNSGLIIFGYVIAGIGALAAFFGVINWMLD